MIGALMKWWFRKKGWKINDQLPRPWPGCIVIAAPHTTNWDFVYTMAFFLINEVPVRFLAKKELFRWPLGGIMRSFGGKPVVRNRSTNMVDSIVDMFAEAPDTMLLIPAEGTRSKVKRWKTGFYHAALKANKPVLLGYLDYEKKEAGFGPLLTMTGDPEVDAAAIRDFYRPIKGKFPENFSVDGLQLSRPDETK